MLIVLQYQYAFRYNEKFLRPRDLTERERVVRISETSYCAIAEEANQIYFFLEYVYVHDDVSKQHVKSPWKSVEIDRISAVFERKNAFLSRFSVFPLIHIPSRKVFGVRKNGESNLFLT